MAKGGCCRVEESRVVEVEFDVRLVRCRIAEEAKYFVAVTLVRPRRDECPRVKVDNNIPNLIKGGGRGWN